MHGIVLPGTHVRVLLGFSEVRQDFAQRFVVARQRQEQVDSRSGDQGLEVNDMHIHRRQPNEVHGTLTQVLH